MNWTAPDFVNQLVVALRARSAVVALADPPVRVLDYWPSPDEVITDAVIIGHEVSDTSESAALGNRRRTESVDVDGEVRVVRPGGGPVIAKAARDRAAVLLGELDDQLRDDWPDVGDQTEMAELASRRMLQFPSTADSGTPVRVCVVEFTVRYRARTPT